MSLKNLAVLIAWIIAVVLFGLVALDIPDTKYDLVAGGLAFAWGGMAIHTFVQ